MAEIVGTGLYALPESFRNGLVKLRRNGLPDSEIVRAYERCGAWLAKAKNGIGECECGCGTKCPVDAVNGQGVSIWHLDHSRVHRKFRGILTARCNHEVGDGDRQRKWSHAEYIEAHEARERREEIVFDNDFQRPGAAPD